MVLSFGLGCNCGTHHFACVLTLTLAKGMSSISICVVQHFCVRCCWISPPVATLDSVIQLGLQLRLASSSERLCCHTLFAGLGCSERRCMLVVHRHHVLTTVALLKSPTRPTLFFSAVFFFDNTSYLDLDLKTQTFPKGKQIDACQVLESRETIY